MGNKMKNMVKNIKDKAISIKALIVATAMTMPARVMAGDFEAYTGTDSSKVMTGLVSTVGKISSYLGAILVVASVFLFVMAMRDENLDGKHRAGLGIGVGIALLGMSGILQFFIN